MFGRLWYPVKKIKELIYLSIVMLGIILIGFELRPMWAHLITKLWTSPFGFMQEFLSLLSGAPYLLLIQLAGIMIVIILAFVCG